MFRRIISPENKSSATVYSPHVVPNVTFFCYAQKTNSCLVLRLFCVFLDKCVRMLTRRHRGQVSSWRVAPSLCLFSTQASQSSRSILRESCLWRASCLNCAQPPASRHADTRSVTFSGQSKHLPAVIAEPQKVTETGRQCSVSKRATPRKVGKVARVLKHLRNGQSGINYYGKPMQSIMRFLNQINSLL